MKWRQVDEQFAVSECGYYAVTKSPAIDARGPLYLAFYRFSGVPSSQSGRASDPIGGNFSTAKRAQNACERHQSFHVQQPQQQQLIAAQP